MDNGQDLIPSLLIIFLVERWWPIRRDFDVRVRGYKAINSICNKVVRNITYGLQDALAVDTLELGRLDIWDRGFWPMK